MTLLVAARFPDREIVGRVYADLLVIGFDPEDIEVLVSGVDQRLPAAYAGGHLTANQGTLLGIGAGVLTAGAWLLGVGGGHLTGLAPTLYGLVVVVTGAVAGAVAGGIAGALADVIATERSYRKRARADPDPEWLLAVYADGQHWAAAELVLMAYGSRVYDTRGLGE